MNLDWPNCRFGPTLIAIARAKGFAGYPGEGTNHWSAGHTLDAARLYRLALEKAPAGSLGLSDLANNLRSVRSIDGRLFIDPKEAESRGVGLFSPNGKRVYVTAEIGGSLTVVDAKSWMVTSTIPLPGDLPPAPHFRLYYADNWEDPYGFVPEVYVDTTETHDQWIEACCAYAIFRPGVPVAPWLVVAPGLDPRRDNRGVAVPLGPPAGSSAPPP